VASQIQQLRLGRCLFYVVISAPVPVHIIANLGYGFSKGEPLITAMM
jgi:hypothetical protein